MWWIWRHKRKMTYISKQSPDFIKGFLYGMKYYYDERAETCEDGDWVRNVKKWANKILRNKK